MGALRDCEAVVPGLLGQPVNSLTTIAFLVAAVVVWSRTSRRGVAIALAGTGIGSFLFHGPMPSAAQVAHDVTLWLLVGVVVVSIVVEYRRSGAWRHLPGPVLLLAGAAIVGRLGSTGGPLCDPNSIWQPHGLWHVVSAAVVVWWAIGSERSAVSA